MNYNAILAQGLSLKKILNGQLADLKKEHNGNFKQFTDNHPGGIWKVCFYR